jgi:hypothetical protein
MTARVEPVTRTDEGGGLYVLQVIGEDLAGITESVLPLVGAPERIDIALNESSGPNYVPAAGDLDATLRSLKDGTLAVASLRTSKPGIRSALLMAPNIFDGRLSRWMGSVDFTAPAQNWRSVWATVFRHERLLAASLSLDDGIELSDEQLSVDAFPWQESRLVIAAVRAADGAWVTRENPNPSW